MMNAPSPARPKTLAIRLLLTALLFAAPGCYTVGFDPVADPQFAEPPIPGSATLEADPTLSEASYSFRAFGSGIANKWTVPYGQQIVAYAQTYLASAFERFDEGGGASPSADNVAVQLGAVDYTIENQTAIVSLDVTAKESSGRELVNKTYSARGDSGGGMVFLGGAFAQKAATRNTTNQALTQIFDRLVDDLRDAKAGGGR